MSKESVQRLGEAMRWTRRTDNKLRGLYGETDFDKKTIRINKKMHIKDKKKAKTPKQKRDARLIDTLVHEEMHKRHPRMHERTVRKLTPKKVEKMGDKAKKKLYSKYK